MSKLNKLNSFDLIRAKHHGAAKLIASGRSVSDTARLTGTSEAQLSRQIHDPAFRDLVARYKGNVNATANNLVAGCLVSYGSAAYSIAA